MNTFMVRARSMAGRQNISVTEAIRRLRASDPSAYERFLAGEAQRGLRVRSGKSTTRV